MDVMAVFNMSGRKKSLFFYRDAVLKSGFLTRKYQNNMNNMINMTIK